MRSSEYAALKAADISVPLFSARAPAGLMTVVFSPLLRGDVRCAFCGNFHHHSLSVALRRRLFLVIATQYDVIEGYDTTGKGGLSSTNFNALK